jgi:NADPH2:quinone reductase
MKAVVARKNGGPEVLEIQDLEVPIPGTNQVLIKVRAAGVNYADILMRKNKYLTESHYPLVPGLEVAGEVYDADPDTNFKTGQRVIAFVSHGGYAEYALADAKSVYPIPDKVNYPEALAMLVQGLTAYFMLNDSIKVQKGDICLVQAAAGGVGSLLVQMCKIFNASTVIGLASTPEKLELVKSLGADFAINYKDPKWVDLIKRNSPKGGVDIVFESVVGDVSEKSFSLLLPGGRMVIYGSIGEGKEMNISQKEFIEIIQNNLHVVGFSLYHYAGRHAEVAAALNALFNYLAQDKLKVILDKHYPLEKAQDAHRDIEQRKTTGKVILNVT